MSAQTPNQIDLARLTRELYTAIQNDSLVSATEIATRLDEIVQGQHQAWLVRDSRERVDEVLTWLPAATESLWVNQAPFTINSEESATLFHRRPTQAYSLDRLMTLNGGQYFRAIHGRTVRLVVAATRGVPAPQSNSVSIPAVMSPQDVVYFYFFAEPIDLPRPDESIQGRPVWQTSSTSDVADVSQPGKKPAQQSETNWIAMARPDLLILANRKELLSEILDRILHGSKTRALPPDLPEWTQTDRTASFWGLRHYAVQSRPKPGERGCEAAELPQPDCIATGATVRFDTTNQLLEIRYLSEMSPKQDGVYLRQEFRVDEAHAGVWRLVADVEKRGSSPVHFALIMLGFGMYR